MTSMASPSYQRLASFTVRSEPGNERIALAQVAEAVAGHGLSAPRLERLKTAVAEAAMNAIEHGNGNRPEIPVDVEVVAIDGDIVVTISDQGGAPGQAARQGKEGRRRSRRPGREEKEGMEGRRRSRRPGREEKEGMEGRRRSRRPGREEKEGMEGRRRSRRPGREEKERNPISPGSSWVSRPRAAGGCSSSGTWWTPWT